jgi:hypothetical protein
VISYPDLGHFGRLGNQLFQMAATIALAMEHNESYGFPRWVYEGRFEIGGIFHDTLPDGPEYREKQFAWKPIPYEPGLRLHGYFQSERYFGKFVPIIRRLFTPRVTISRTPYRGVASVHVRRGDYLAKSEYHTNLTVDYYERAERKLRPHIGEFIVFSDDPDWCEENLVQGRRGWRLAEPGDEVQHLAEMSGCEAHIIANSSFSWWGAWLDPNELKKVIAPKAWFGPAYADLEIYDLIPASWRLI